MGHRELRYHGYRLSPDLHRRHTSQMTPCGSRIMIGTQMRTSVRERLILLRFIQAKDTLCSRIFAKKGDS